MHSFHHSRGRIFFEVLARLRFRRPCVGAWMQTGASALLAGSGRRLLYGLVHTFDLIRRRPASPSRKRMKSRRILTRRGCRCSRDQADPVPEVAELASEPAPPHARPVSPKLLEEGEGRGVATCREVKVAEPVPDEEPEVVELAPDEEPATEVPMPFDEGITLP